MLKNIQTETIEKTLRTKTRKINYNEIGFSQEKNFVCGTKNVVYLILSSIKVLFYLRAVLSTKSVYRTKGEVERNKWNIFLQKLNKLDTIISTLVAPKNNRIRYEKR